MSYFLLPYIIDPINPNYIELKEGVTEQRISKSLSSYLNKMKEQINNYQVEWDIYKKYTNQYEYIHTIIPFTKVSVCKLRPLSRSFYKLIEIFNLLNLEFLEEKITSFHLAEGPGGFIEALVNIRCSDKTRPDDLYYGMTLINDNDENVPGWKKSKYFLSKYPNVKIVSGVDGTGNLFNPKNLEYCIKHHKNSMDLITADGGFDFSINFNEQEGLSINLVLAQIIYAIALQKYNGTFILKVFDLFTDATIDLIYILSTLYEKTYIVKPYASRSANSERYIVCKYYKLNDSTDIVNKLMPFLDTNKSISRFINFPLSYLFLNKIEDINAIIGQQQLENILATLHLVENNKPERLDSIKKNNIQKCIQWCTKNKLPYNKSITQLNMFIQS